VGGLAKKKKRNRAYTAQKALTSVYRRNGCREKEKKGKGIGRALSYIGPRILSNPPRNISVERMQKGKKAVAEDASDLLINSSSTLESGSG